ncbi:Zn-ribbon domain-containing OB-fold protein [Parvularcula marina]|nr:zinc ribbon domain-containing protein [Parvularcula marina]
MTDTLSPLINDLNRPYWEAARQGELCLPHCVDTGRAFWPPSPASPYPNGRQVEWRPITPRGTVSGACTYRRVYLAEIEEHVPYGIVLVEVEPAVRLQAFVPQGGEIAAGEAVQLSFEPVFGEEFPVLTAKREAV